MPRAYTQASAHCARWWRARAGGGTREERRHVRHEEERAVGGFPEFERYDGLGLAALVRDRQVSAAEVLEAAVERIDGRDGALNAVIVRLFDDARRRVERGLPDGPFTGVPFLIKDITVQVAGAVTASGSRLFATAVADHDSEIVARYRRAGL